MCGGSTNQRCLPSTTNGDRARPVASRPATGHGDGTLPSRDGRATVPPARSRAPCRPTRPARCRPFRATGAAGSRRVSPRATGRTSSTVARAASASRSPSHSDGADPRPELDVGMVDAEARRARPRSGARRTSGVRRRGQERSTSATCPSPSGRCSGVALDPDARARSQTVGIASSRSRAGSSTSAPRGRPVASRRCRRARPGRRHGRRCARRRSSYVTAGRNGRHGSSTRMSPPNRCRTSPPRRRCRPRSCRRRATRPCARAVPTVKP